MSGTGWGQELRDWNCNALKRIHLMIGLVQCLYKKRIFLENFCRIGKRGGNKGLRETGVWRFELWLFLAEVKTREEVLNRILPLVGLFCWLYSIYYWEVFCPFSKHGTLVSPAGLGLRFWYHCVFSRVIGSRSYVVGRRLLRYPFVPQFYIYFVFSS